jgi:hypothetical protein
VVLIIVGLLILWAAITVLGFAVKALVWLAVIGIGLFLATAIAGAAMLWNRK